MGRCLFSMRQSCNPRHMPLQDSSNYIEWEETKKPAWARSKRRWGCMLSRRSVIRDQVKSKGAGGKAGSKAKSKGVDSKARRKVRSLLHARVRVKSRVRPIT